MDFKEDIKNSLKLVGEAASDVAQALATKSRLRANANRLRQVIKSDSDTRNQAYIELGRYFYENLRDKDNEQLEGLCVVVDKTTMRIDKATKRYIELIAQADDTKFSGESAQKIKQIVNAKAEKAKEYTADKVTDIKQKAKTTAADISEKVKDTAADISDKAKDKIEDIKDTFKYTAAIDKDFDNDIEDEQNFVESIDSQQMEDILTDGQGYVEVEDSEQAEIEQEDNEEMIEAVEDEESPDEFTF